MAANKSTNGKKSNTGNANGGANGSAHKSSNGHGSATSNEWRVKVGLAEMLKGGVIMDVINADQAGSRRRRAPVR